MLPSTSTSTRPENISLFVQQSCQNTPSVLLEIGSNLLQCGQYGQAMAMFDASFHALSSPPSEAVKVALSQQLELESHGNMSDANTVIREPVDTYLEDECDVGPRPFRKAFVFKNDVNADIVHLSILYNKALAYHSMEDTLQAFNFYQLTLGAIYQALPVALSSSDELFRLAMYCCNNLGHISYYKQMQSTASLDFEKSLAFAKRIQDSSPSHSLDIANVISNWCRSKFMDGDVCPQVYEALEEVLRIRMIVLNESHHDVASAHFNLGMAEYLRRNNSKAISHFMQFLNVASHDEKSGLDSLPGLIYILLIKNDGKDDKVSHDLVFGLRSLQEKRNEVGPLHPEVASLLNFIGTLLFHQQELDHALLFFQEELRLEELFTHSKEDFGVSVTCNNIGRILQELGRLPQAIQYYQKALQDRFGDDVIAELNGGSFDKASNAKACSIMFKESFSGPPAAMNLFSTVWYNLGLIHDKMGADTKAIKAFQMSLKLRRAMLGPDHADVACLVYNIGVLQMEQQLLKEATDSFREALRIRQVASTGQLNDGHVVKTLQKLASLHKSKGNIQGALDACRQVVQILTASGEFDLSYRSKNMGMTLRDIADLYHAQGDLSMALETSMEGVQVLRTCRENVCTSSPDFSSCTEQEATTLLLVGSLYHEVSEPGKARECFEEAARLIRSCINTASNLQLLPILEVSMILGSDHCAPEA